jgi:hypothetical protein
VFKFWSAFAGRLGGRVAGEVEEVGTVGVGDAVTVTGGVVDVGTGGKAEIGEDAMVPGRGRCTPITLPSAGDRAAA